MDIKYIIAFIFLTIFTMFYNCLMVVSLCYVAYTKNWWAILILIPFCFYSPHLKIKEDEGGKKDE